MSDAPPEVAQHLHYELTVKFIDELQVRALKDGSIVSGTDGDLTAVRALIREFELTFSPAIDVQPEVLDLLQDRGQQQSGVKQPDLGSILRVHVNELDESDLDTTRKLLEIVGTGLQDLPQVRYAEIKISGVPPPRRSSAGELRPKQRHDGEP